MDPSEVEWRRSAALEALQDAIDQLGPITDETRSAIREPVLHIIGLIGTAGEELQNLETREIKRNSPIDEGEQELHKMKPHGALSILLGEDAPKSAERIYVLKSNQVEIPLLGSELEDLSEWWGREKNRPISGG